jgi:hypothetical protein
MQQAPPIPDDELHAKAGREIAETYATTHGTGPETTLSDMLTDLMHAFGDEIVGDAWEIAVNNFEVES